MQDLRLCVKIDSDETVRNDMKSEEKCILKNELFLSLNENDQPITLCLDYSYFNMHALVTYDDIS